MCTADVSERPTFYFIPNGIRSAYVGNRERTVLRPPGVATTIIIRPSAGECSRYGTPRLKFPGRFAAVRTGIPVHFPDTFVETLWKGEYRKEKNRTKIPNVFERELSIFRFRSSSRSVFGCLIRTRCRETLLGLITRDRRRNGRRRFR